MFPFFLYFRIADFYIFGWSRQLYIKKWLTDNKMNLHYLWCVPSLLGKPVRRVFIWNMIMYLSWIVLNYIEMVDGMKHQKELDKKTLEKELLHGSKSRPLYPYILYRFTQFDNWLWLILALIATLFWDSPTRTLATKAYLSSTVYSVQVVGCFKASIPCKSAILTHVVILFLKFFCPIHWTDS